MADAFDYRLEILKSEIGTIQSRIGTFDDLSFRVKGWAATLWAGLVGYALSQNRRTVILAVIPLMGVFWALDALFKKYQHRIRARMWVIEQFIGSSTPEPGSSLDAAFRDRSFGSFMVHDPLCYRQEALGGDAAFKTYLRTKASFRRAVLTSNVAFLYLGLSAGALLLYYM